MKQFALYLLIICAAVLTACASRGFVGGHAGDVRGLYQSIASDEQGGGIIEETVYFVPLQRYKW
jgi:hypothetical protein